MNENDDEVDEKPLKTKLKITLLYLFAATVSFFGVFFIESHLLSDALDKQLNESWQITQEVGTAEDVMKVEIPENKVDKLSYNFMNIGLVFLFAFGLLCIKVDSAYESEKVKTSCFVIICALMSGLLATLIAALFANPIKNSELAHENQIENLVTAVNEAPQDKKFVYRNEIYSGKDLGRILKKEFLD